MRHYLPYILMLIIIRVGSAVYARNSMKPYANPQQSMLKTNLLSKQPILSPYAFWVNIQSTWRNSASYPKPFKTVFDLYDEGIVVQARDKIVQLAYEDINYLKTRELLNDIVVFTKLEDPIAIAVRVSKYDDVLRLLASKGVKPKTPVQ